MFIPSVNNICRNKNAHNSFYTAYHKTFEIVRADSIELLEEVFKLRYRVYCKDNGFIDSLDKADEMEHDIYDNHSLHSLLYHRKTGIPVGTVRVVLPNKDDPHNSFPLQKNCNSSLLRNEDKIPIMCEISRLCMVRSFRSRNGDDLLLPTYNESDWFSVPENKGDTDKVAYLRRIIPYAPLGLIMSALDMALDNNINNCFFAVEKRQINALNKAGMEFSSLGPDIGFVGEQVPIIFNIKNMLHAMEKNNKPCWEVTSDQGRIKKKSKITSKLTKS
jgi:N-acyl amino acid synthase of PEP-CTERM/exosortase system